MAESEKRDKVEASEETKSDENSFFDLRTKRGQLLFFSITVATCVLIQLVPVDQLRDFLRTRECNATEIAHVKKPTYWIYGAGGEGQWTHVKRVLGRLGYERVTENEIDSADLLWAHDYPFNKLKSKILAMKAHQKINHLPGCGFLTNKVDLSTTDMKYIPPAFRLPQDEAKFRKYADENPDKLFVVKHHQHRHIKIKRVKAINFKDNETFIQEFIHNPLLVDGYKFDIGVYTIITSIDPLRVYIYSGDVLFRYCPQKYHPFDAENLDKYVVGDDYLPTWQVPSLSRYYNALGLGMRGSFDAYMRSKGKNPQVIWTQVEDAIRLAILTKQPLMKDLANQYRNKLSFFEMARFDLIIDENLKVYLIEANMSPNLSSTHFQQNTLLYEQVIYNLFTLVGVASYISRESLEKSDTDTELMISSDKNIYVEGHRCAQAPCAESCSPVECQFCKPCVSRSENIVLHRAYREHMNRGDMRRIFPPPISNTSSKPHEDEFFKTLSPKNQFMSEWFHKKCLESRSWCS